MSTEASHIVPYRTFFLIWLALLCLTGVTIGVAQIDLGALNVWVALAIATIKSSLVVMIFMHLKYEQLLFKLAVVTAILILAIFIGFTFFDVLYR